MLASGALAQTPPAAKPPEKAGIQGQVVNAATGEPLRKAQLALRTVGGGQAQGASAVSDPGGNFAFQGVEPGRYRLFAERTGFVRGEYGARGSSAAGTPLTVSAGQKLTGVELRLTPQAVLTGRVLDEDGEPVSSASVQALRYSFTRGRRQLSVVLGGTTDDRGEYRLYGLAPGKYYVSASQQGSGGRNARPQNPVDTEEIYAPTFYPNAVEPATAVALDAAPGAVLGGLDVTLAKVRTVRVSGKVTDSGGKPAARNTRVFVVPREGAVSGFNRQSPVTMQQGMFVARGLRPGAYVLGADTWDGEKRSSARLPIDVGSEPLDNLNLTLVPAIDVPGRVRVDGTAQTNLTSLLVVLQSRTDSAMGGAAGGRVKEDGAFTLTNAAPEAYTVSVSGLTENFYVKSIRQGQTDALASGLNLTHGAAPVDIVISPAGGQIDGVSMAGEAPAAGATVVAVPDERRDGASQFYKSATADQDGRFSLKGLAPGGYKLYAWENVEAGAWLDPDFLKQSENAAESVSIQENARETRQLKTIPAGK